jgi:hypothetical protein
MPLNPITEEIREVRRRLAAALGNDVYRIGAEIRKRQAESGRRVVRLPKRPPDAINTTNLMPPSGGELPAGGDAKAARR